MVIILAGSREDYDHVDRIKDTLKYYEIEVDIHYASAHKQIKDVLSIIDSYQPIDKHIYITVAGKSNALSGIVSGYTKGVVIACPPFRTIEEYMVDIHSTLRMPSSTPVLTILSPENCALAVKRLYDYSN